MSRSDLAAKLVTRHHPKSPVSEAFRSLRTSLRYLSPDQDYRAILVTSPGPGEGKSTVLANLAVALAQSGKTVVVFDTDLRRPSQHHIFDVPNDVGLTNLLVGESRLDSVVRKLEVENLSIITSGPIPPNPSELLQSPRMQAVLAEARSKYEYVLLDSPPVLPITDAAILSSQVDGVIMIIKSGQTRVDHAREAQQTIEKARGKLVGAVLNLVRYEGDDYRYYYYYGRDRTRKASAQRT
jgi:capsular exopolysaccharide synthesis family protein